MSSLVYITIDDPQTAATLRAVVAQLIDGKIGPLTLAETLTVYCNRKPEFGYVTLNVQSGHTEFEVQINLTIDLPWFSEVIEGRIGRLVFAETVELTITRREAALSVAINGLVEVDIPIIPNPDVVGATIYPDRAVVSTRVASVEFSFAEAA